MTLFSITDTSAYMKKMLLHETCGTVHSVYRKTINLSIGGTLAALQAKGSPVSPISLITTLTSKEMEGLGITAGDAVTIENDDIIIRKFNNSIIFSFAQADVHNLNLFHTLKYTYNTELFTPAAMKDISATTAINPDIPEVGNGNISDSSNTMLLSLTDSALHQLHDNIKKSLAGISTGGFEVIFNHRVDDNTSMMLLAAQKRIEKCTQLYIEGKHIETGAELARLIGLGIGLTPSGDDFLCGMLAGLILAGQTDSAFSKSLRAAVTEHLTDTVDVSAAFLRCALEGQFSLAVNHLLVNVHKESSSDDSQAKCNEQIAETISVIADVPTITQNFLAIGHSSGTDTLCGIMYILELLSSEK